MRNEAAAARHALEDAAPNAAFIVRFVNPLMRLAFATPLRRVLGKKLAMLRFVGRRSGRDYEFPVGILEVDGEPIVTSRRVWQHNFSGGATCSLRRTGGWEPLVATRVADIDECARMWGELIKTTGIDKAKRGLGLEITVGRQPSHDEIVEGIERLDLSIIRLG